MKRVLCAVLALLMLADVLPAFAADGNLTSTPVTISGQDYLTNLNLACAAMNGCYVASDSYISFNNTVGPRSKETGYKNAINGRGAKVIGGGVSQVAATLYLALQAYCDVVYADIDFYKERFTAGYCDPSDAVITDYKAGHDLKFYNLGDSFTIYMWCDGDDVFCEIDFSGAGRSSSSDLQAQNRKDSSGNTLSYTPKIYRGAYEVDVSSYRVNNSAGSVDGYCAVDGDLQTAWNTYDSTVGEYIHIQPVENTDWIVGFRIVNGYAKSDTAYKTNARPKELEVWLDDGLTDVFLLEDTSEYQTFYFTDPAIAYNVSFYINDVYSGSRYNDCCITEIELLVAESIR